MDKNATIGLGLIGISAITICGLSLGHDGYLMIVSISAITGVLGWILGRKRL